MSSRKVSTGKSKRQKASAKGSISAIDGFVENQVAAVRAAAKECGIPLSDWLRCCLRYLRFASGIDVSSEEHLIHCFRVGLRRELHRMLPDRAKQSSGGFRGALPKIETSAALLGKVQAERDRRLVNGQLPYGAKSAIAKKLRRAPKTVSRLLEELRRLEQK